MKRILILFCAIVLIASCKQKMSKIDRDEYGTVVLDFTSKNYGARAVGANGLPDISSSKMEILAEEAGGSPIKTSYREGDEKKYEGRFSVGSDVKLTVVVMGKSGQWKGEAVIKVERGDNFARVKLSKSAISLKALKFSLTGNTSGQGEFTFKLGFAGGTPFFEQGVSSIYAPSSGSNKTFSTPSFCRDRFGRTYVLYAVGSAGSAGTCYLKRFDSEGSEDATFSSDLSSIGVATNMDVVQDWANDNVFVVLGASTSTPKVVIVGTGGGMKGEVVLPVEQGASIEKVAVYDNVFAVVQKGKTSTKLGLFRYNDGTFSQLQSYADMVDLDGAMRARIEDAKGVKKDENGNVLDMYMRDGALYVLYNFGKSAIHSPFGGVLKYDYSVQRQSGRLENGRRVVGKSEYSAARRAVNVQDENRELFGALRFVGFSEDALYLADDGERYEYDAGVISVVQNKNRLVSLGKNDASIQVVEDNMETWLPEKEEVSKNIEPLLFYSKVQDGVTTKYLLSIYNENSPGNLSLSNFRERSFSTNKFSHVFDGLGNLYLLTDSGIEKYTHGRGANYERDGAFSVASPSPVVNGCAKIIYDSGAGELYFLWSSGDLSRYEEGGAQKITHSLPLANTRGFTVYGNKVYVANSDVGINVYRVGEDYSIDGTEEDKISLLKTELEHSTIDGMYGYNDVLFICHTKKNSDRKTYISGINLKDGRHSIRDLETGYVEDRDYRFLGFNKGRGEVKISLDFPTRDYDGRAITNENKYASLSMSGAELGVAFHDAPSGITWAKEWNLGGTKDIMLFSSGKDMDKTAYYAKNEQELNDSLAGANPSFTWNGANRYVYDIFCYDQLGNLYVLFKDNGDYYIVRFQLKDDGTYNFSEAATNFDGIALKITESTNPNVKVEAKEFAMCALYLADEGKYRIYYTLKDASNEKTLVKMHECDSGREFHVAIEQSWKLEMDKKKENMENGWTVNRQILSMTANKDGVFIAEKEVEQKVFSSSPLPVERKYSISVKKYSHKRSVNYGSPDGTVYLVGGDGNRVDTHMYKKYGDSELTESNITRDEYIEEKVSDMYAYNGTLYALMHKKVGAKEYDTDVSPAGNPVHTLTSSGGSIWKLGETKSFGGEPKRLHTSDDGNREESGKFSPYHFIAVLPRKLVIASDGFYGRKVGPSNSDKNGLNYNFVFFLDLDAENTRPEPKATEAHFSLKLKEGNFTASSWDWE